MNQILLENNYIYVPKFLSLEQSNYLAKDFENFVESNSIKGDSQIEKSSSFYNFMPFVKLLVEKIPHVSSLAGEPVLPTYTYARVHKEKGAELVRHRDRDACEVSLTVNLAKSEPWPICIQKPNGEEVCLEQEPGDAMLYLGCIADHWREPYKGSHHTQVFLHYVFANGSCSWAYFDKQK